jgi:hypothetical protein
MDDVRLYIAVSSCRDWKPQFGSCLLALHHHLLAEGLGGRLRALEMKSSTQASCLSASRQSALTDALKRGFTHFLSLDDDMVFPQDTVEQLMRHGKAVITANYRRKQADKVAGVCMDLDGQILDSTGKSGLQEIGWMGGGCALFEIEAIKPVPAPHFEVVWSEEHQDYFDQDNVFSHKLRKHGVQIWCDHDLSQQVSHIGDYHFQFPQQKLELIETSKNAA